LLDAQYRFLRFVELFRGTIDGASVHPREIVKLVLEAQSAAVVRRVRMQPCSCTLP
jgi:DNA repair protein RadC